MPCCQEAFLKPLSKLPPTWYSRCIFSKYAQQQIFLRVFDDFSSPCGCVRYKKNTGQKKTQSQHMRDIECFMVKILQAPWRYQISQRQHTTTLLQICRGYLEELFVTNYQFMHHHSYECNPIFSNLPLQNHGPRKLTYPTLGKGKSSSNMPYEGDMLVPWSVIQPTWNAKKCRRLDPPQGGGTRSL